MASDMTVRVIYPLKDGRIVLRTDHDWNANVEAQSVSHDRTTFEFRVSTGRPFFYFKPCVIDRLGFHWSIGANYLAVVSPEAPRELYPHFFSHPRGRITDVIPLSSAITPGQHFMRVYLPPGYRENTLKRYPVLYMHDGKNLFFPHEAFLGAEWRVDETMDMLDAMNLIDKTIVVGVYPHDRMSEYTRPGYERFGRFLVEELKPLVDRSVRTLAGPRHTSVMGSSLGGVVSFYLAWQWPEVFGRAACLSSTFTYRDDLMQRVASEPRRDVAIYLDSGWPGDNYEVTRSMRDLLLERGYQAGKDLLYFAFPEALHNEAHWAMRSHIPFQFFFGKGPRFSR
jgi:enterochelin esterase-like enzyme